MSSLCLNSSQSEQSLIESLYLCVRLKAAVNHFVPCRHGRRTQIWGWLKRGGRERKRKCCFSQFLVILPSDEPLCNLHLPPGGYSSSGVILFSSIDDPVRFIPASPHRVFHQIMYFILYHDCCHYYILGSINDNSI